MIKPGRFVVLEGTEGVGKSTNLLFVSNFLESKGLSVKVTREPGGTIIGERLRSILLEPTEDAVDPEAELLMMFAARAQHVNQVIKPALAHGEWIVCDRFTDASYAYQGGGRKIPMDRIAALESWVLGDLRPDLVLILDAPVDVGVARARQRAVADRFEMERNSFFERVREAYLTRALEHPERYVVINAAESLDDVQQAIKAALESFLVQWG